MWGTARPASICPFWLALPAVASSRHHKVRFRRPKKSVTLQGLSAGWMLTPVARSSDVALISFPTMQMYVLL
ncbi:hypothetical protein BCV70DRAFT_9308 [Testicularia cyperi]|uniref:Secreted protein n=1 Tax=Testicularia cyperi TaxID=1882483 RepID=A0A317XYK3_9BASI|nr:hypothetical protein BCV70DRAFT_9308 [Testicularia cyperi]